MHILINSCAFPPEPITSAWTSHSLAAGLRERGHEVTVIAPYPSRPGGHSYPGYHRRWFETQCAEGDVRVVRCFATRSRTASLVSRLCENLSFGVSGGIALLLARRPDLIYSNTWPILASGIVAAIARLRRIPLVVSVQDIYPESLLALGRTQSRSILFRVFQRLDVFIAQSASAVTVLSRRAQKFYREERGIPSERLHLIQNWGEMEPLPSPEVAASWRRSCGLATGTFIFMFAGNLAPACGIGALIQAASDLPQHLDITVVIAGAGSMLDACRAMARGKRIVFSGQFAREETLQVLRGADVLLLPTQGDQSLVSMPSKLISFMMASQPIVAVARKNSDLAMTIMDSGCGWVVDPEDIEGLTAIMRIASMTDRNLLSEMGSRGRKYALAHFSTDVCRSHLIALLERVAVDQTMLRQNPTDADEEGRVGALK